MRFQLYRALLKSLATLEFRNRVHAGALKSMLATCSYQNYLVAM